MGGACVALAAGPEAAHCNAAGLAEVRSAAASFSYTYPFGLQELALHSSCVAVPSTAGCFSAGLISYGFELYREDSVSLGYANSIRPGLAVGLNLKASRLTIERFGTGSAVALDLGLLAKPTDRFRTGIAAWNILGTRVGGESLDQSLALGAAFDPHAHLTLCADAHKDLDRPLQIRCGAEYRLGDLLALSAGAGNAPTEFSCGLGVRLGHWRFDYAVRTHLVLGLSHALSVAIRRR